MGLILATVGLDPIVGTARFTFGSDQLADGVDFVIVAMGLFGVGEILYNLEHRLRPQPAVLSFGRAIPTRLEWLRSRLAILRGSVVGFVLGVLPGGGATMSSLVAYAVEKRSAKDPSRFGKGAIEGVAGPESANNAAATSSFIPLLTLGIPANATMAVLFGALLLQGIPPGPQLIVDHPDVFWGVVNSMYVGNILLLLLSIPLIGVFVRLLKVRAAILAPLTVLITMIGVYSIRNNVFDMFLVVALGLVGYGMKKLGFEPGPFVLAFVLGELLESSFRRSMRLFGGDLTGFVERPVSAVLVAVFLLAVVIVPECRSRSNRGGVGRARRVGWWRGGRRPPLLPLGTAVGSRQPPTSCWARRPAWPSQGRCPACEGQPVGERGRYQHRLERQSASLSSVARPPPNAFCVRWAATMAEASRSRRTCVGAGLVYQLAGLVLRGVDGGLGLPIFTRGGLKVILQLPAQAPARPANRPPLQRLPRKPTQRRPSLAGLRS